MSNKRGSWISRRGQTDAAAAIDQVIDRQQQPDEQIQMIPDNRIVDSPYQARQPFDEQSLEELAQGMRESGFQGVLIARPHSDAAERRRGMVQLIYGHRRRVAWRKVCEERGEPCLLPVVVREISDEQMLTIGAQENLQRQDLDPLEEAQIVAWHERMFFNKNQLEIGTMLGKSVDWVKTRSRIHKLPEALKERLRTRPRAISQMLELGVIYPQQPDLAIALADRVVTEQMTLDVLRTTIRNYERPTPPDREKTHIQSGTAQIDPDFTSKTRPEQNKQSREKLNNERGTAPIVQISTNANSDVQRIPPIVASDEARASSIISSPPWFPLLYDSLAQATQALHDRRDAIADLDDGASARLQHAMEDLLRELALITDILQRPR
jgi:ParB family transcriptional regulator, chromosome partitioning protein